MKSIRGGMGIGDAIYVHAVARHLIAQGERLMVSTKWPEVFRFLPVECYPFTRSGIDILAHYSRRKAQRTTQFEDVCIEARCIKPVELKVEWQITDQALVDRLKRQANGRPIVLVQLPRAPMGRTDGLGLELLPDSKAMQRAIDRIKDRVLLVQVGSGEPLYRLQGIEVDLANQTTVSQLFDAGMACDGVLGYVSFILPLAESMGKPGLMVWSRKGLKSKTVYIRQITPQKCVHRRDLIAWVLDGLDDEIDVAAQQLASRMG